MNIKLSTDELFHFTQFDNLISILKEGFYPHYNIEHNFLKNHFKRWLKIDAVPIVCFCDIPLNMIHNHTSKYGSCAIGLDKKWGEKFGLSPVFYIHNNSMIGETISFMIKTIAETLENRKLFKKKKFDKDNIMFFMAFALSLRQLSFYIKQYERTEDEHYNVGNKLYILKKGRFYDEREWRYVLHTDSMSKDNFWLINSEILNNKDELEKAHEKLKAYSLNFDINDIKYIISETEEQKEILLDTIAKRFKIDKKTILNKIVFQLIDKS